tara:strand:- start:31241 stop:31750 length:510 start_codon:yes stop_codon:yes gene_type:complete
MKSIILAFFITFTFLTPAHSNFYDNEQLLCIAKNIYWEARNQPFRGMVAVGQVTMNRVKDSRFPDTPCEVVQQGPTKPSWKDPSIKYPVKHRCQFSWFCDGKSDVVPEYDIDIWEYVLAMSTKIATGYWADLTHGATHYHADYVTPSWAKSKQKTRVIGDHIFYIWKKR